MYIDIKPCATLRGTVRVPGDKSISHRAAIFGAIAKGVTRIANFNDGLDVSSTLTCLMKLGVDLVFDGRRVTINGKGYFDLAKPAVALDAGNSGTTVRLLAGILAAQDFSSTITGDDSLQRRPMQRIIEPLRRMGADITASDGGFAPLHIRGSELDGIDYVMPVASAQVKSCLLLAGLGAWGTTTIREPAPSRDHSERLLRSMGALLSKNGTTISIRASELRGIDLQVPGDLSSAAFLLAAALLMPNGEVHLPHVGINPTRRGFLEVAEKMGARLRLFETSDIGGEPVASIRAESSHLTATEISGSWIPRLIDEILILAVLATQAQGQTVIRDAAELRVKESDRLHLLAVNLRNMGAAVEETADGLLITGPASLHGADVTTAGDHRLVMAFAVAGLIAQGVTRIHDAESVAVSYPGFFDALRSLGADCGE